MAAGLMALALPTTWVPAVTARCDVTYRVLYLRMMIHPSICICCTLGYHTGMGRHSDF